MLCSVRRARALRGVASWASLCVLACSALPSYKLVEDGGGPSVVDGGIDDGAVADASVLPDGRKCFSKKDGDHFRFFMTEGGWDGALLARPDGERPDDLCRNTGATVWPGTHFRAYYWSTPTQHPSSQLSEPCDGWWTYVKGVGDHRVFPNRASLYGAPEGDINFTEKGEPVTTGALQVWTGGDELNVTVQARCGNWDQASGAIGTTGWPYPDRKRWMKDVVDRGCTAKGHLYCIETP